MAYLVDFPTRVIYDSETRIHNIFVINISSDNLRVRGIITLLSDRGGQVFGYKLAKPVSNTNTDKDLVLESALVSKENFLYY